MKEKKRTFSISRKLADELEKKAKETSFKSIDQYINYILEQIISEPKEGFEEERGKAYTEEEEKDLKKSLKEMGYL